MLRRVLVSVAYLIGGFVTLFLLLALRGFAQSQAAMSAASISASGVSDALTMYLIPAYFFVSAVGILISRSRFALCLWATAANGLLLTAYGIAFVATKQNDSGGHKWTGDVVGLALIMFVYFLPWSIGWAILLLGEARNDKR
jgi:hypothetical protein